MNDIHALYLLYKAHPEICTDTRKIKPGCIFFALYGANFDGNTFAQQALKDGAALAVVSDIHLSGPGYFYTPDTLLTLQQLAQYHRSQLTIPLIAITGSNGKTTTKELITQVLREKFKTHATAGNLNNHIGVPLTLLSIPPETELVVCEMGANHHGEIRLLCEIAQPTHGIITNIGKAHLEGFGSIDGVQKAKGELFDYLTSHDGYIFYNTDDPRLRALGKGIIRKTSFGFDAQFSPDILFHYSSTPETPGFTVQNESIDVEIHSGMFGFYNAVNLLAAFTIGAYFKVHVDRIISSLESFIPGANRSESVLYKTNTIIKDAYNANPTSMELAIRAFAEQYPGGWIVIGDMKELGDDTDISHQHILQVIEELRIENVVLVGEFFMKAANEVKMKKILNLSVAKSIEELNSKWDWSNFIHKPILLKGSRSMHMEKLLQQ